MSLTKARSYSHSPETSHVFYYTVQDKLRYYAENSPSKEACVTYDTDNLDIRSSITCFDLYKQACCFARGIRKLGLKEGDIVGVALPNGPTAMICIYGTQLAGCIPLLFMFVRQDGSDIVAALNKCKRCSAIVVEPGRDDTNWKICCSFIQDILPDGSVKGAQITTLRYLISSKMPKHHKDLLILETLLNIGKESKEIKLPDLDPDDVAAILLTSGSTGIQKPVQYTHINFFDFASHIVDTCEMNENYIYLNANIFSWVGGYPHIYLFKGITRVTCTSLLTFKSLAGINEFIMRAVEGEKCTFGLISVPCILEMSKRPVEENLWAHSFKTVLTGGMPIPASCANILNVMCENFFIFYGTTEVGLSAHLKIGKGQVYEDYNVGFPLPGNETKIVDDTGEILPINQTGEVYVRHCSTHLLYHNDREKSDSVYLPSRWYKTNDIGYMNKEGQLIVCGRKSDMLIVGGELVAPSYLESVIQTHPSVQEVVVTSVPDEMLFQQACACIIPRPGHTLSETLMDEFFRKEFVVFPACRGLVPKYFLFFDSFPKTVLGKTSRSETKDQALKRLNEK